jgi:hypothetical protein
MPAIKGFSFHDEFVKRFFIHQQKSHNLRQGLVLIQILSITKMTALS